MVKINIYIILGIIFGLILFFGDITITVTTNQNVTHTLKYNGLVFVGLDYYSIKKNNSNDTPIKWVTYTKN